VKHFIFHLFFIDLSFYADNRDNRQQFAGQGMYRQPYPNQAKEVPPPTLLHHGVPPATASGGNWGEMDRPGPGRMPQVGQQNPIGSRSVDSFAGMNNPHEYGVRGFGGNERSFEPPGGGGLPSQTLGNESYFSQNLYQQPQLQQQQQQPGGHLRVPYPLALGGQAPPPMMGVKASTPMSREMFRPPPQSSPSMSMGTTPTSMGGSSNAQGRAVNKMLLDILRERVVDPQRLCLAVETFVDRMDCVNLATLLFHTGKKRIPLTAVHIKQIADRFNMLNEELRAREASNALYGLKCLSSDQPEVRELIYALAKKIAVSGSEFVAQAVGNALYGLQLMSSEHEEVRYLVLVLSMKVNECNELLEAQNVGNALYGLRGMNSDHKEVRALVAALTPKIANAREDLNGQALGNSLYGLQCMSSKEAEVRCMLSVLAAKVTRTWEELKAQEVGNALYGLKRMSSDIPEVRMLIAALVPKIASSPELLDAQAIGNSFYGLQNMNTESAEVLSLIGVLADKVALSNPELDGQAMGNSLYGLQGMNSDFQEVRNAVSALTVKIQHSMLEMNAQELGNALYGMQNMNSNHSEVRRLMLSLAQKISNSKHELGSQEIGNALFGLQGMSSEHNETRVLVSQIANKIRVSHSILDPQGVSNSLFGLQRLSSESTEVKSLVHALAMKVEHCWKPLGAHHIGYACFGLQRMTSESSEVKLMLKTVSSKIAATKEEMSTKQICYSLYGLQNMSGDSAEVLSMISAITEKINASNDIWMAPFLSLALFGMQGLNLDLEETDALLEAIVKKAAAAPLDFDAHSFGNALYGLQRVRITNSHLIQLFTYLFPSFERIVSQPELVPPSAVANIFIGLQGKNLNQEIIRSFLQGTFNCMLVFVERIKLFMQRSELNHDIYQELSRVYQCATLCLFSLQDSEDFQDFLVPLNSFLSEVESLLEENVKLVRSFPLSMAEANLAQDMVSALPKETTSIAPSTFVSGFEVALLVKLFSSAAKTEVEHTMVLEIIGSSYAYPCKELFYSLRNKYLEAKKGITVVTMAAELFAMPGQQGIVKQFNMMNTLLSTGLEESADLTKRVNALQSIVSYFQRVNPLFIAGNEYVDDEISQVQPTSVHEQMKLKPTDGVRRPFAVCIGWIGMLPYFHSNPLGSNNSTPVGAVANMNNNNNNQRDISNASPRHHPAAQQQQQQQQYPSQAMGIAGNMKTTPRAAAAALAAAAAAANNTSITNIPGSRLSGAYQIEPPPGYDGSSMTNEPGGFNNFLGGGDGRGNQSNHPLYPNSYQPGGVAAVQQSEGGPPSHRLSTFIMPDIRINTSDPMMSGPSSGLPPSGSKSVGGGRYPSRSPMASASAAASAITPRQMMNMVSMTAIAEGGSSVDTVAHGEEALLNENDRRLKSMDSDLFLGKQVAQEPEDVEIMEARMEIVRLEKRIRELNQKKLMRKSSQNIRKDMNLMSDTNDNLNSADLTLESLNIESR
jgi:hypothetical protein